MKGNTLFLVKTYKGIMDWPLIEEYAEVLGLTEFNEFINHGPKPFEKIIDRYIKL